MIDRKTFLRLLIATLLVMILSVRRDGFFPFSGEIAPTTWAWLLTLQVLGLFGLLYVFFRPESTLRTFRRLTFSAKLVHAYIAIPVLLVLTILALHYSSSRAFPEFFHVGGVEVALYALLAIPLLTIPLLLKQARWAIVSLFAASFILMLIPLLYYQITANTADLLPIIQKQLADLSAGQNIYQYFPLDNGVLTQAVRQPGTTLSFWPAFALGLDIRWMSVIFTLLTGCVLFKFAYANLSAVKFDRRFILTYTVLALFLLFPYRHVRHDLYEPAYWLLLSLSLYMLYKHQLVAFVCTWALGILTQVWFWLFTPFVSVYLWRVYGFRKAFPIMTAAAGLGGGMLALFILRDPGAYLEHVFGFYAGEIAKSSYAASTIHLTPLVYEYGGARLLLPLQLAATAGVGVWALIKLHTWKKLLAFLCLVFTVFVQLNSVSWNYMYIGLVLLLLIYILTASAGRAPHRFESGAQSQASD